MDLVALAAAPAAAGIDLVVADIAGTVPAAVDTVVEVADIAALGNLVVVHIHTLRHLPQLDRRIALIY